MALRFEWLSEQCHRQGDPAVPSLAATATCAGVRFRIVRCDPLQSESGGQVVPRTVYVALGVSALGRKQVLGLYLHKSEGGAFLALNAGGAAKPGRGGHPYRQFRQPEGLCRGRGGPPKMPL